MIAAQYSFPTTRATQDNFRADPHSMQLYTQSAKARPQPMPNMNRNPHDQTEAEHSRVETRSRVPSDIDCFGMRAADRKRKSSDAISSGWSTLEFVEQLQKRVKGLERPNIVNDNDDQIPNAYTTFQPVWKPEPKGTIVTEAKFTLPIRKRAQIADDSKGYQSARVGPEVPRKRGLSKPDEPTTALAASKADSTPRRLRNKAAQALASLSDEFSASKTLERPVVPQVQKPVKVRSDIRCTHRIG